MVELGGGPDYRLGRIAGLDLYVTPLGPAADAAVGRAWSHLTEDAGPVFREIDGARPLARHSLRNGTCGAVVLRPALRPAAFAAADYLAIARRFDYVVIDHIPLLGPLRRDEARRFTVLIDTLYDEGVKLVCSAAGTTRCPLFRRGRYGRLPPYRVASSRNAEP